MRLKHGNRQAGSNPSVSTEPLGKLSNHEGLAPPGLTEITQEETVSEDTEAKLGKIQGGRTPP